MDKSTLDRLNRRLADAFGLTPSGEGRYKWAHTSTVMMMWRKDSDLKQAASGLWLPDAQYEQIRQEEEDYWTIASWEAPPTPEAWVTLYGAGADIPYPQHGMFYVSNVRLPDDAEPTDAYTEQVIGALRYKHGNVKTFRDALQMINGKLANKERRRDALYDDWIKDQFTAGFNVPGSRGFHASFPAVQKGIGAKEPI